MRNQRGIITLDFIFSFMLVMGLVVIFLGMTFTLSVIQVVQYISFSTARTYYAANADENNQIALAQQKFANLTSDSRVKPLFSGGWFTIDASLQDGKQIGDFDSIYNQSGDDSSNTFQGVRLTFVANLLQYRIPIFGSTYTQDGGFSTVVGSYLMREPNQDECETFNQQRFVRLLNLSDPAGQAYKTGVHSANGYVDMSDNGC